MVNEVAKRLIFQYFPNHSVTDTLKNTLTSKNLHCRFFGGRDGRGKSTHSQQLSDSSGRQRIHFSTASIEALR